ncbi:hypothetical protein AXA44_01095 [Rhodococcus sp. SC4]|nr:hypothetical protein AXA44_01095 [Rhodococcus sp. SC4]
MSFMEQRNFRGGGGRQYPVENSGGCVQNCHLESQSLRCRGHLGTDESTPDYQKPPSWCQFRTQYAGVGQRAQVVDTP